MAKLAIVIPIYNQPDLLRECLCSLQKQSNKNFSILLFDDASIISYKIILDSFRNLNIVYEKNSKNKGALENMNYSYNQAVADFDYVMLLHEDDMLASNYIETVWDAINAYNPVFIISKFLEFESLSSNLSEQEYNREALLRKVNTKELCMMFLENMPLAFGSVVYKTQKYPTMQLLLEKYAEFADRPFLLEGLNINDQIALINAPLYYYRSHSQNDTRWKNLRKEHVFNLVKFYKNILVDQVNINIKNFKQISSGFIFDSYKNLQLTGNPPYFLNYLLAGYYQGLLSIKYTLLKFSFINKTATKIVALLK